MGLVALIFLTFLQACSPENDVSTANLHENEKAVPSVQARIEQYLSSDDIQIYVHEKESVPNSLVIYSSLPPRGQELERKILALRIVNQVVRDYPSATSISIWDDEEAAAQIAKNGDQELSWDGYLHRVAFATKDSQGVRVSYALGKDDFENISFGMSPAQ